MRYYAQSLIGHARRLNVQARHFPGNGIKVARLVLKPEGAGVTTGFPDQFERNGDSRQYA